MEFNSDFRYDLKLGQMAETKFHEILSEKKIEVKYDRKTKSSKNLFIETESRNKPSGIRTTEADYWTYFIDDNVCFTIPVDRIKKEIIKMTENGNLRLVRGGDSNTTKGVLIPAINFI